MERLLDQDSTAAIILGAHDWSKAGLVRAPSFRSSARAVHRYLTQPIPVGLGLPPHLVLDLFDDDRPASAQFTRIADYLRNLITEFKTIDRPLRDVFLYYIGHGSTDKTQLYLLIQDSREGYEEQTSIGVSGLAQILHRSAPQQRRVVILDCCFSEAAAEAFGAMGTLENAVGAAAVRDLEPGIPPPDRGTILLCSSPRKQISIGPPNAERTLFTGALLDVLENGSPAHRSELLSFAELQDDIYDRMLRVHQGERPPPRPALHQPDQQLGDLTRIPAFPNAAARRALIEQEEARQAAEAQRKAEEERQAAEAQRKTEEERQAAEARRKAEEERQAAEGRRKAKERQAAGAHRKAKERQAAEARKAEEEEQAAEARRKAEEKRQAAEARRKAEEEQQVAEAQRKADEEEVRRNQLIRQAERAEREARRKVEEQLADVRRIRREREEAIRKREDATREAAQQTAPLTTGDIVQGEAVATNTRRSPIQTRMSDSNNLSRGTHPLFVFSAILILLITLGLCSQFSGSNNPGTSTTPYSSPIQKR